MSKNVRYSRLCLVHLGAGIGNVVLATPLLIALHELGFTIDVLLAADYAETAELLHPWSVVRRIFAQDMAPPPHAYDHVIPALPPFYAQRFGRPFAALSNALRRPSDALFYRNEQEFYLHFARALGFARDRRPMPSLPIAPSGSFGVTRSTLVLAPGCKTGEMAAKRWPHYSELADEFDDVAVVGTADDLHRYNNAPIQFAPHIKTFVDRLTLRQTAELVAGAGAVVANDTGLAYVSAAVGTPTLILFGPTPHTSLGQLPPNVRILRTGLACEPCWFDARFRTCAGRIDCLAQLPVDTVISFLGELGFPGTRYNRLGDYIDSV
jgi:ADP-heptose:LPS heptosyltransferase